VGKASSSKKVQRAARAAAASRGTGEKRERGFPLLVGVLVILGIGLVLAARSTREEAVAPFTGDHWHNAVEFYDCGTLLPALVGEQTPSGIHTHSDSMAHIEPSNSAESGENARFGVWLDAAGASVTTSAISTPDFGVIEASEGCDGEPSEIVAARWDIFAAGGPAMIGDIITDNFDSIRFLGNAQGFTFARVPVGEAPPPPSQAAIDAVSTNTGLGPVGDGGLDLSPTTVPGGDMSGGDSPHEDG
jgi:hypothetical protein